MNGWMDRWSCGWLDERMDGWVNGWWINGWFAGSLDFWLDKCRVGTYGQVMGE